MHHAGSKDFDPATLFAFAAAIAVAKDAADVHLGARPDPHSGQIMIVQNAPRKAITENEKLTPWTNEWHQVKVVRDTAKGTIEVYFDDMKTPHMQAIDKTFGKGGIGIGSFDDMNDFDDIKLYGR